MNAEYEAIQHDIRQRSNMQHGYLLTNIAITGATMAFALTASDNVPPEISVPALFCIPLMSFSLFMLWVHQAFVILHRGVYIRIKLQQKGWHGHEFDYFTRKGKTIMVICFALGILGVFVAMPASAIYVGIMLENQSIECPNPLKIAMWAAITLNAILFTLWITSFYFRKNIIVNHNAEVDHI